MDTAGSLNLGIYAVRETCVDTIPQNILSVAGAAGRRGFVSRCGFLLECSKITPSDYTSLGKNHKAQCGEEHTDPSWRPCQHCRE